jgi:hypothetical protein
MKRYTVRIRYTDGRDETSAPLTHTTAAWFYATMRASHGDIVTIAIHRFTPTGSPKAPRGGMEYTPREYIEMALACGSTLDLSNATEAELHTLVRASRTAAAAQRRPSQQGKC